MPEISSSKLDTTQYPSLEMIEVEGGSFRLDDRIECKLSSFFLGRYLVTQALWEKVMEESPSRFMGSGLPVEQVSWYDCLEFCNLLSANQSLQPVYEIDKEVKDPNNKSNWDKVKWGGSWNPQANGYRLPTEAEWEYAARGGKYAKTSVYAGSGELKEVGWFGQFFGDEKNAHGQTEVPGLRIPNELGLHDMSGNVWEWCWDWRGAYPQGPLMDPKGPNSGNNRVLRGGSWFYDADYCRVANRSDNPPFSRSYYYGLRLARTVL